MSTPVVPTSVLNPPPPPAPPIRVMCVDDNRLLAEAMERQIMSDARFHWVGWIENTDALVQQVLDRQPDVLLLDIDMPGQDVFTLVREMAEAREATRVLMFSAYVRQDYIDRAVEMGAWGYVSKNEEMRTVLSAIERAAAGEFVLTNDALVEQRAVR